MKRRIVAHYQKQRRWEDQTGGNVGRETDYRSGCFLSVMTIKSEEAKRLTKDRSDNRNRE